MSENTAPAKPSEKILERIRKLFNYAHDGSASPGEVENAMGHAARLMAQFGLSEDEVLVNDDKARESAFDSMDSVSAFSRATGGMPPFFFTLARAVSAATDTGYYKTNRYEKNPSPRARKADRPGAYDVNHYHQRVHVMFYGLPRDTAVAVELYRELSTTLHAMAYHHYGSKWTVRHGSYADGFAQSLALRAAASRKQANDEVGPGSTAIVLCKKDLLRRKKEELGLVTGRASGRRSTGDGDAYNKGYSEADGVSMTGERQVRGKPAPAAGRLE